MSVCLVNQENAYDYDNIVTHSFSSLWFSVTSDLGIVLNHLISIILDHQYFNLMMAPGGIELGILITVFILNKQQ